MWQTVLPQGAGWVPATDTARATVRPDLLAYACNAVQEEFEELVQAAHRSAHQMAAGSVFRPVCPGSSAVVLMLRPGCQFAER